ncbi:unnamed protein product [marine sediment metagenome]|uniref:Uncharacterized protein n=1 Tax=marine sediment metagenome TaxID=412755 RepID=X1S5V4_9ZZZZ
MNSEAPTEGQLLKTYDIDSVAVVYPDTFVTSFSANVQVFQYPRRFLVIGSFKCSSIPYDPLLFTTFNIHQWVLNTAVVEAYRENIFIKTTLSESDLTIKLYGKLLKGKYN